MDSMQAVITSVIDLQPRFIQSSTRNHDAQRSSVAHHHTGLPMKRLAAFGLLNVGLLAILLDGRGQEPAVAQGTVRPPIKKPITSKPPGKLTSANPAQVQEFEQRAKKAQEDFVRESADLAKDLEEAGLFEEAKAVLETISKIKDDVPGLKDKLAALKESALGSNKSSIEVDVAKGWTVPVGRVEKGKPFRVESTGTYRFSVMATLGPNGFPTDDLQKEMLPGLRCGALCALIMPVDDKGKPGKPLEPIEIGEGRDVNPKEGGLLFLNVNLPPGHKSTGKIDVILSGHIIRSK